MPAPDYAEPLVGWRVWCVEQTRFGLRLASVIREEMWIPGTPLVARCVHGHPAPDPDCTCGIYAAREPSGVLRHLQGRNDSWVVARVLGRVLLWGTVVEHEDGWRAAKARPLEIISGEPDLVRRLGAYDNFNSSVHGSLP